MSDFRQILSQAKQQIKEVSPSGSRDKLNPANGFTLLDVREGDEWEQGHLDKAMFLPRGFLEQKADRMLPNKQQPIVVYCAGGTRSALAAKTLQDLGYTECGFHGRRLRPVESQWLSVRSSPRKSVRTRWRDTAVICLFPKLAKKGQLKLLQSKVLLVGAGGLGSPAGVYLAASGVGTIGLSTTML